MCPANPQNVAALEALRERYYFPVLERAFQASRDEHGLLATANNITNIMRESERGIMRLIQRRVETGEIKDVAQTRKSLAGNGFQALVLCALITMQEDGLIPADVIFSLKPKSHPLITEFASIHIGNETLKPDLDLLAYTDTSDIVAIYSLKTSLRERAGQTHRWKLLLDIVTAPDCESVKKKYELEYNVQRQFVMSLITTNFYGEIMKPQQRGLLRFFDKVYLTKPEEYDAPVSNFANIADDLSELYAPAA